VSLAVAAVGVLSATVGDESSLVLALFATAIPAVGTAIAAYVALFGFERLSKLYADAEGALASLAGSPDSDGLVPAAEEVMRREQGQWGQFANEQPFSAGGGG
jgi:hypothetical protein